MKTVLTVHADYRKAQIPADDIAYITVEDAGADAGEDGTEPGFWESVWDAIAGFFGGGGGS